MESWSASHIAFALQKFVNQLFGDLSRQTQESQEPSKLDALVIGTVANNDPLQQHCFIRGKQQDALSRTVAVGVPVTRTILQRSHPYTDMLDVDPNVHYDVWERRASRAMFRPALKTLTDSWDGKIS
jgi:hypothetical protein